MTTAKLPALMPHEELPMASRLRLKLLGNDRGPIQGILDEANELAKLNRDWMLDGHQGVPQNCFLHYAVDAQVESRLSPDLPLFGLIEACTSGASIHTLS